MEPTLREGDWLIAVPPRRLLRAGDLVVLRDPREARRLLVKRVRALRPDGSCEVAGDNAALSSDSRTFGPVPRTQVVARVAFRYAPLARIGRVR
ncbi:MAG: S26 family signal peptidase [Chloroflexota bacterium]|nr:S26 family signal peptidase [Chloroflexota bacterium]